MSLNKTSPELILDLINEANQTDLGFSNIDFANPQILSGDPDNKNTGLGVNAIQYGGYTGGVTVKYNRIDLADLDILANPSITIPVEGDINDVVNSLNELYELGLTADNDIDSNVDLTNVGYEPLNVSIDAVSNSLAYFGSLDVEIAWESIDLDNVITSYTLNGLNMFPPDPLEGSFELRYTDVRTQTNVVGDYSRTYHDVINNTIIIYGRSLQSGGNNRIAILNSTRNGISVPNLSGISNFNLYMACVDTRQGNNYPLYLLEVNQVRKSERELDGGYSASTGVGSMPLSMYYTKGLYAEGAIWVMENLSATSQAPQNVRNTSYRYDIDLNSWEQIAQASSLNNNFPVTWSYYAYNDGFIYKCGGRQGTANDNVSFLTKCFRYSIAEDQWEAIADLPYPLHTYSSGAAFHDGYLYIVGGNTRVSGNETDSDTDDIFCYNPTNNTWSIIGKAPMLVRDTALISVPDGLYMLYGRTVNSTIMNIYKIT